MAIASPPAPRARAPALPLAAWLLVLLVGQAGPGAAAAEEPPLVPRMAPAGGLELHRSPARVGGRAESAWNAMIDDRRGYVRLDDAAEAIAEGISHQPGLALGAHEPRVIPAPNFTFSACRPTARVHHSYALAGGEGRGRVGTGGAAGRRLHFEGRSTPGALPTLVEWAYVWEFRRVSEELARAGSPCARRALARLPARYYREGAQRKVAP